MLAAFTADAGSAALTMLEAIPGLLGVVVVFGLYFLPSLLANHRKRHNQNAIILMNVFFGWTVIGWFIALIWAATSPPPIASPTVVVQNVMPMPMPPTRASNPVREGFCDACGTPRAEGALFCRSCGCRFPAPTS